MREHWGAEGSLIHETVTLYHVLLLEIYILNRELDCVLPKGGDGLVTVLAGLALGKSQ